MGGLYYNHLMAKQRMFVGLSSGWSKGIDAALVAISGRRERMKVAQVGQCHHVLHDDVSDRLREAGEGEALMAGRWARLDTDVGDQLAQATSKLMSTCGVDAAGISAIGFSGCAVRTEGSMQDHSALLGSAADLAAKTSLPVVGGFPLSDIAAGGIGGPMEAWPDWLVFRHRRLSRVVVHLGGAASITFVPAASDPSDVLAFDVAPCGIVLDRLAERFFHKPFDADGVIAATGRMSPALLNELYAASFFHQPPPKLANPHEWPGQYIDRVSIMAEKHGVDPAGQIATYTELIARAVSEAIAGLTERPHEVILAGGAARNIHLAARIRALMSPSSTYAMDRYGFSMVSYKAVCYAVLAAARIDGHPAHCTRATGGRGHSILGAVWLPPVRKNK